MHVFPDMSHFVTANVNLNPIDMFSLKMYINHATAIVVPTWYPGSSIRSMWYIVQDTWLVYYCGITIKYKVLFYLYKNKY